VQFVDFAKSVCAVLAGRGYWADYIDPCSGLPVSATSRPKIHEVSYSLDRAGFYALTMLAPLATSLKL